jgi:hypothetical protein
MDSAVPATHCYRMRFEMFRAGQIYENPTMAFATMPANFLQRASFDTTTVSFENRDVSQRIFLIAFP